ncbi:MAG TPA: adenylate/guanylate cyclase domain-containing protein [Elusimicrobiota bacterium]|nr:adenylate/guanylate cyclase domain-containing protein [Elusimicrobiota bacterium]HMU95347.1 adenylate/guanylate cyclase domain-containing protein [Elusimicrobiota bacterium]HMX94168.1 adenylate/guanylate cyclase domain-containing protein [Elusimicrobiota bacterium]HMZ26322.1 adenylate/guanylate cyclase domain-containing protein [Elusimicrobiota bacterium]HNA59843.1 adenylate/guanylate cyclase domain-containing protein [Elusimicrobiota bacterium]
MKRPSSNVWSVVGITAAVLIFYVLGFFDRMENASIDFRFARRGLRPADSRIVLITINDDSLKKLGLYPWPREIHARLVDLLTRAGAEAVAFDVLFLEEDTKRPDGDRALGRAASANGRVVFGGLFTQTSDGEPKMMDRPIATLRRSGIGTGFVNVFPEKDGILRSGALWVPFEDRVMPSLSLAALSVVRQRPVESLARAFEEPTAGDWHELMINFTGWKEDAEGSPSPYRYYSYADVLSGRTDPDAFKNKIVIVCGTATGLFDTTAVPNLRNFPGPEIHANLIDNLLNGTYLRAPPVWVSLPVILLLGLAVGPWLAGLKTKRGAAAVFAILIGYYALCQFGFNRFYYVFNFVVPLVALLASYGTMLFRRLLTEEKEKRRIKSMFGQYVSPKVIDILIRDSSRMKLGGEERHVTLFFSDIAGFTTVSEKLTPQELVEVLNDYLSTMTDVILDLDGTLDKFIGDAIMAFWNAPLDQPKHALLACRAAVGQMALLPELHRRFGDKGWPIVEFRIGLNTGPAVIGNMGSSTHRNFTAVGDTVNLASRLEGANKMFGTRILISESTLQAAKDDIEVRELDFLRVKGKTQPIRVYELLALKNGVSPEKKKTVSLFTEGLALYRDRRFTDATAKFFESLKTSPDDKPSQIYIKRCEQFLAAPPPADWDGVYVMTSK